MDAASSARSETASTSVSLLTRLRDQILPPALTPSTSIRAGPFHPLQSTRTFLSSQTPCRVTERPSGCNGQGNPEGSACLGYVAQLVWYLCSQPRADRSISSYNHYVELVEPAGNRACIKCCCRLSNRQGSVKCNHCLPRYHLRNWRL
jgi:hypothetical protein